MDVVSYNSLRLRDLEPLPQAANKQFYNYFRETASPKGSQYLYSLCELHHAEKEDAFEGIFKTKTFFTNLHTRFVNYVKVETENNLKFLERHDVVLLPEQEPEIVAQPPRKSVQVQPDLEEILKQRLDQMESALYREVAIARLQNDRGVIEAATKQAADAYVQNEGKAIADAWQKNFDAHKAHQERLLKHMEVSLKRTRDERDQIKSEIIDEQIKLRRIERDVQDLETRAEKQASAASYVPRAGKAPMLAAHMQTAFRKD
jgi:hypothetical protein